MKMYINPKTNEGKKIPIKDIVYLTSQLRKFINVYEKCIYLDDEKSQNAFRNLKEILRCLENRDYQMLFQQHYNDIDFDPSTSNFTPEEIVAWNDFFHKNKY